MSNTPDYSNDAFDPSEIGNTIHQHKMLQNQVRPEEASNMPFEDGLEQGLDKIFPCDCSFTKGFAYRKGDPCDGTCVLAIYRKRAKDLFTQLHKAAIVAELEKIEPIASHQLAATVADRIEQYKKEGK